MKWYELAENPTALAALYTEMPLLQPIELLEVVLLQDGPQMTIKANLSRFADKPPQQWSKVGYNTLSITLDFVGVEVVQITRWSTFHWVNADIERTSDGTIVVRIISPDFHIEAVAHSFRIAAVQAYLLRRNEYTTSMIISPPFSIS